MNTEQYTFSNGKTYELDEIAIYGVEREYERTDTSTCEIGSMLVNDENDWRDATEEELDEVNSDKQFIHALVTGVISELIEQKTMVK